jgi:hypothetical protein
MKKIFLIIVWMFVFLHVGAILLICCLNLVSSPDERPTLIRLVVSGLVLIGSPLLALILGIRGALPGTRNKKTVVAESVSSSSSIPPVLPRQAPASLPPVLPKGPREFHHAFTHENIPMSFIVADNRAQYVAGLFGKELKEIFRKSWRQVAMEVGEDPDLANQLDLTTFRNDPYACGFWEFPPAKNVGEASLGLLVVGPLGEFASINWATIPVRYFILELDIQLSTRLLEWSPSGFKFLCAGPPPGRPITVFSDMVFDHIMGKKRPTAEQAAKRLLILKHLGIYAQAVPHGQRLNSLPDLKPEAKGDLHSIFGGMFSAKLREENLWDDVSPKEKELLELHVKDITQQQLVNALWRLEDIQMLMWALGLIPSLPLYDVQADGELLKQIPSVTAAEFITSAKLREEKEIDRAREVAEMWHWRSRTRQCQEEGRPCPVTDWMRTAGLSSYEEIIRKTAVWAAKDGKLPKCIDEDFPVNGKAYRDLTLDEWSMVRSITMERHFALNWLCGYAPDNQWDNTPTET